MRELALTSSDSIHLAKKVSERGWVALKGPQDAGDLSAELLSIAGMLGQPMLGRGGLVESLKVVTTSNAPRRSLSALHGRGAFPLHTDGAHLLRPPRLILLACVEPGCAIPTTLFRFIELGLNEHEHSECEQSTFLYRNGPRSFYSSIIDRTRPFIRLDRGCMVPTDAASEVIRQREHEPEYGNE